MTQLVLAMVLAANGLAADGPGDLTEAQQAELSQYFGFSEMQIYKLHPSIFGLRLADLDGDKRLDIALWNATKNRFELFLQPDPTKPPPPDALGAFERNEIRNRGSMRNLTIPVAYRVSSFECADVTGDGLTDIVFFGEPRELVVLAQRREGGFEAPDSTRAPEGNSRGGSLAVGDFNGDGKPDVALLGEETLFVYPQKPEGGLAAPTRIVHNIKQTMLAITADVNGDKRDDLVVGVDDKEYGAFVVLQDAGGKLGAVRRVRVPDLRSISIAHRNGGDELFCVESATGQLKQYRWETPDSAAGARDWPQLLYSYPVRSKSKQRPICVGDATNDGRDDVVAVDPDAAQLILFRGVDGGLEQGVAFPGLAKALDVQIGDVDGDGKNEVISVSREEKMIGVSHFADGRLTFPAPIGISGAPLAATTGRLRTGESESCLVYLAVDKSDARSEAEKAEKSEAKDGTWIRVLSARDGKQLASWKIPALDDDPRGLRLADVNRDGRNDVLLFVQFQPLSVFLQAEDGSFAALEGDARAGLVKEAALEDCALGDVTGDGKLELLIAQKNLARALHLAGGRWEVSDQYNPETSDAELKGFAVIAGEKSPTLVTYDRKTRDLLAFRRRADQTYAVAQSIPVGAFDLTALTPIRMDPARPPSVLLADAQKIALLFPEQAHPTLVEKFAYETRMKDAFLRDCVVGDLNHDGVRDVAVLDTRKATVEILTTTPTGALVRATSFQVFQGKRFSDAPDSAIDPREAVIGDVTGDGHPDLVLIAHDRLLVYPAQ